MSTTSPLTANDLLELPGDGRRHELVRGELRMMSPSGWLHGNVVGRLHTLLGHYVYQAGLGEVFGAETGFLIEREPDTVRCPDIAFIAKENIPTEIPSGAFWLGAPDLVVEVLSPHDKTGEVDEKIRMWLAAGARMVWVVDPMLENVTRYFSATEIEVRTRGQMLEGEDVVPGFSCSVDQIFVTR